MKPSCTVYWFKRDLRLQDNEALCQAARAGHPLLLVYLFEPSLEVDPHYSPRHWGFIRESLCELQENLVPWGTRILCVRSEAPEFFAKLGEQYEIRALYSHCESGIDRTFERDRLVAGYLNSAGIPWREFQQNGVQRGRKNREGWAEDWHAYMRSPLAHTDFEQVPFVALPDIEILQGQFEPEPLGTPLPHGFQKGGRRQAFRYLETFFNGRLQDYQRGISRPEASRESCSRLSPYLAWGNLSVREVFQRLEAFKKEGIWQQQAAAFGSRLRWHCHFIQKFEMEPRMEFEALNRGMLALEYPHRPEDVLAWEEGRTGYPLVDAAMRCLRQTGYVNFRLRALVVSFLTHHLFQHFSRGSHWLARQFLDFEPGIHYGQLQMQAGLTGTNTIRVYNPTLNAQKHDPEAVFIKKYLPELEGLPPGLAIEPWKLSPLEAGFYGFRYGADYPERIVDMRQTRQTCLKDLFDLQKSQAVAQESQRILKMHTLPRSRKNESSRKKGT